MVIGKHQTPTGIAQDFWLGSTMIGNSACECSHDQQSTALLKDLKQTFLKYNHGDEELLDVTVSLRKCHLAPFLFLNNSE